MANYQLKKPSSIKRKKRIGCGTGSGHGKTSCRGTKGQLSRSGSGKPAGFEGGQMPLQRRIPKRGFNNIFKTVYQIVNISQIEKLGGSEITPLSLLEKGIIKNSQAKVKILGGGEIKKAVKVTADAFSEKAAEKIKAAGGEAIIQKASMEKK